MKLSVNRIRLFALKTRKKIYFCVENKTKQKVKRTLYLWQTFLLVETELLILGLSILNSSHFNSPT